MCACFFNESADYTCDKYQNIYTSTNICHGRVCVNVWDGIRMGTLGAGEKRVSASRGRTFPSRKERTADLALGCNVTRHVGRDERAY